MAMERGESSSSKARKVAAGHKRQSPLTIATLQIMKERADKRTDRKKPGGTVLHFDNTDHGYGWLLPGWIAEERHVPSGRLYRVKPLSYICTYMHLSLYFIFIEVILDCTRIYTRNF